MPAMEPAFVRLRLQLGGSTVASQIFRENSPAKISLANLQMNNPTFKGTFCDEYAPDIKQVNGAAFEDVSAASESGAEATEQTPKEYGSVEEELRDLPDAVRAALESLPFDDISSRKECESPAIGSIGHYTGTCRPCAWWWNPSGCSKAELCGFCHLCDAGVVKMRKKERLSKIKMWKARPKMLPVGRVDPNRIKYDKVIIL